MAIRKLIVFAALLACLALAGPAWADTLTFNGFNAGGQGLLSFTPGLGDTLTIGPGNGANGALVTDFLNTVGICGGDCTIIGGYLTLTSGAETSGSTGGGSFTYSFGAGGTVHVYGEIPSLGITSPTLLFSAAMGNGETFSGAGTVGSFLGSIDLSSIVLNPALGAYSYIGGSTDQLSISISPSCSTGGVCSGSLIQTTTSLQTVPTPEPGAFSLLGAGLFVLLGAGVCRKRLPI